MSNPPVTIIGNLVEDPELKFTPSGAAVANFRIAQTPRKFDRATNSWVDEETIFMSCSVWRETAENVAETLVKGMRVWAYGKLKARTYTTQAGDKRTVWELAVEEVGPSLRYATAKVTRRARGDSVSGGQSSNSGGWGDSQPAPARQGDATRSSSPWNDSSSARPADTWGNPTSEEPPF
jgi:single-strand DNA-binding protein